jgi:hypothetical protein
MASLSATSHLNEAHAANVTDFAKYFRSQRDLQVKEIARSFAELQDLRYALSRPPARRGRSRPLGRTHGGRCQRARPGAQRRGGARASSVSTGGGQLESA